MYDGKAVHVPAGMLLPADVMATNLMVVCLLGFSL